MKRKGIRVIVFVGVFLSVLVAQVIAAPDKYTLRVPNGLAFSDFRAYENWQVVAVSQTENLLKVMVADPTMIDADRAGVPGNGKPFRRWPKIAKIEWKPKKSTEAPFSVRVPDVLQDIFLIDKDNTRFTGTKGLEYAAFEYDPASDTFKPDATGVVTSRLRAPTRVAAKDYIFPAYGER
jgi:cytochrome P460